MSTYAEPDFYRLNEDSLRLVEFVTRAIGSLRPIRILDLGAGSGVIGIELANAILPLELTLVEVQPEWEPYLALNIAQVLRTTVSANVHISAFSDWKPAVAYDLIVSNPPYFLPGHGRPASDPRRELCRSFIRDGWAVFLKAIERSLASEGSAFLVVRNDVRILRELEQHWAGTKSSVACDGNLAFVTLTGCRSRLGSP